MPLPPRSYTGSEQRQRVRLLAKGMRGAYGDVSGVEAQLERIDTRAADRARLELEALNGAEQQAEKALAEAKAKERSAAPSDRTAAWQAVREAKKQLERATRARNHYRP